MVSLVWHRLIYLKINRENSETTDTSLGPRSSTRLNIAAVLLYYAFLQHSANLTSPVL